MGDNCKRGNWMTRDAYNNCIKEDISWLRKQPESLERDHIERILMDSINQYYSSKPAAQDESKQEMKN